MKGIRALGAHQTLWDDRIPGFCARRRNSPAVVYGLKYRTKEGRQRWHTIGRHGAPWTPETARDEARRILAEVATGNDPAGDKLAFRQSATVAELCDEYLRAASEGRLLTRRGQDKKQSTLDTDRSRIAAHIKPLLGNRKIAEIGRADIEKFMHDVAGGKTKRRSHLGKPRAVSNVKGGRGAATRTVGLLGAIFNYGVRTSVCNQNPVVGIVRFADGRRNRRLTDGEYLKLGKSLGASKEIWPYAIAAARFLTLTGWRSGEALKLRWSYLDLKQRVACLPDTKTGASVRVISRAAIKVLEELPRSVDGLVFPSHDSGLMSGFPLMFRKVARFAELPQEVTPHVLRHSFASVAADLGFSELTIAALLGHRAGSITSRYTHQADTVLLAASDVVAAHIDNLMSDCKPQSLKAVVPLMAGG
ncbi:integrase [Bradyrhizobium sp. CIR18]|uniref:site-specific integrase n=1 Tax=Bradyrhizobium sp. CIR18 TaxID=2663839 RepID=UPI001605ADD8|nr:site-specific integrase [Bradyrhizobium sp. CIR18]MBB4362198.1 integrase [Bradyrhizobium sp. CIR18]